MEFLFSITRGLGSPPITALAAIEEAGSLETAVEDLSWLCDQAAKYDLKIMLEFFGSAPQLNRVRDVWQMIQQSKRENCGLLLDSFCLFMGDPHLDDLEIVPPERISTVHISDAKPKPRHELDMLKDRLLPGQGIIPLQEFVDVIKRRGYDGYFTIEIHNEEYAHRNPLEIARVSREALEDLLNE